MSEDHSEGSGKEEGFMPLKPRAYHINQAAIEICNGWKLAPSETIIALVETQGRLAQALNDRHKEIETLKSVVPVDGRPIYTLQEFGDVMRKVTQTEGVMLHEKQKGFFRDLFKTLTDAISRREP